ncbi:MAG: hypothetical protein EG826_02355 [Deltaproteobacteria bacterium]|nr:hypothetical protein [Deltaproteobacteria bacterium]
MIMRTKRYIPAIMGISLVAMVAMSVMVSAGKSSGAVGQAPGAVPTWSEIRSVQMQGDLKVFWNVIGGDVAYNNREAVAHGFRVVNIAGTYSDYPGNQKENIHEALKGNKTNPWKKPDFFERIIRRNIAQALQEGDIFVHDIEFNFEEDIDKAWLDKSAREASGAKTKEEFSRAYFREWASWFSLPCKWAKEARPGMPVGIYGPQPFRRDYWGVAGKSAQQIDGSHRSDAELWQHIDPFVDFYIASVYIFYDDPGSIYYLAANIEENYQRTRRYGNKPVYAYEWLRYHDSNKKLAGQELSPYMVEAMAVLPYFCGAKGVVLWGWEPGRKGQYYQNLPLFMESLGRIAGVSSRLSKAELVIDEPAHVLWKEKRPLTRKLKLSEDEWVVLAINPWQKEGVKSTIRVVCGKATVLLPVDGQHTGIFVINKGRITRL